jgi:hypothetical protein
MSSSKVSSSSISDETGDNGDEGVTPKLGSKGGDPDRILGEQIGDEEADGPCSSCAKESESTKGESAGENGGGGDEGGNGEDGVNKSSTSILLSLSLVNCGKGSMDPRTGDVGTEDGGRCGDVMTWAGDGAELEEEVTSGTDVDPLC